MLVQVVKSVMKDENAVAFFNDPVDAEGLGFAQEYRDVVKVICSWWCLPRSHGKLDQECCFKARALERWTHCCVGSCNKGFSGFSTACTELGSQCRRQYVCLVSEAPQQNLSTG